jgi:hypothetical protein
LPQNEYFDHVLGLPRRSYERWIDDRCQGNEGNTVREVLGEVGGDPERQAGLADAARAG